jgi:hypothetical protein
VAKILVRSQHDEQAFAAAGEDPQAMAARADKFLFLGILCTGTLVLGPIGVPITIYALRLLRKAEKAGAAIRPWIVTAIGTFVMIDAAMNFLVWSIDLFPAHDAFLGLTIWPNGYGRMLDGGYYIHYNTMSLGGTIFEGEKALEIASTLILFPWRVMACWGFLKMKRWGLQNMVITTWLYIFLWVAYMAEIQMNWPNRFGASLYGFTGYWVFSVWFFGPFIVLPYFYTVNRERWAD